MIDRIINIEWVPLIRQFTGQLMPEGNVVIIEKEVFLENIQNGNLKRQRQEENLFFLEDENRYRDIEDLPADKNLDFEGDDNLRIKDAIWTRDEFDQVKVRIQDIPFVEY